MGSEKKMTLPNTVSAFVRWIYALPDEPESSRTLILSSYSTFQMRALYSEEGIQRTQPQQNT